MIRSTFSYNSEHESNPLLWQMKSAKRTSRKFSSTLTKVFPGQSIHHGKLYNRVFTRTENDHVRMMLRFFEVVRGIMCGSCGTIRSRYRDLKEGRREGEKWLLPHALFNRTLPKGRLPHSLLCRDGPQAKCV